MGIFIIVHFSNDGNFFVTKKTKILYKFLYQGLYFKKVTSLAFIEMYNFQNTTETLKITNKIMEKYIFPQFDFTTGLLKVS